MVLSVVALVTRDPDPDEDAVNRALSGNSAVAAPICVRKRYAELSS